VLRDEGPHQAPTTATEQVISAIWQELLQVSRVDIHSNFFDLGGHSLLMVQVHEKLSAALGRRLPMVDLFRHPTVAALAQHLGQAPAAQAAVAGSDTLDERARKQRESMQHQRQLMKAGRGKR
jgi:acyl carrier protein